MNPREHPTGIGTVIAGGAVILLQKLTSVDLTVEEAVGVTAAVGAVISLFTPRFRQN